MMKSFMIALFAVCVGFISACGGPAELEQKESADWSAFFYGDSMFITGQMSEVPGYPLYTCPSGGGVFQMFETFAQEHVDTPPAGQMPTKWRIKAIPAAHYLLWTVDRALSTIDCPWVDATYSAQYNVLYNTSAMNCTIFGHKGWGGLHSYPVTVPVAGLQYVPGTNTVMPYWGIAYSGGNSPPEGSGYCGPAQRAFSF